MHAANIGPTASIHAASSPVVMMASPQRTGSAHGAAWDWAKALGIAADEPAGLKSASSQTTNKADWLPEKSNSNTSTKDASAATAANEPAGNKLLNSNAIKLAVVSTKKAVAVSEKTAKGVDSNQHKLSGAQDDPGKSVLQAPEPADAGPAISMGTPPEPIAISPVAAKTEGNDKGMEKTATAAGKRPAPISVKGTDASPKTEAVETKTATASADASKNPSAAPDEQLKTVEAPLAVPQSASHPFIHEGNSTLAVTVEANAAAHAPAAASRQPVTAEPKTMAAAAGAAEINSAHTISAGPGQLEVGVLDGTHGWLSIRTEAGNNGTVSALVTSSAAAHESLRDVLPAMAGYLASEQLNVSRLAVGSVPDGSFAGGALAHSGQGSTGQPRDQESNGANAAKASVDDPSQMMAPTSQVVSAAFFGGTGMTFRGNGLGSWLSVTA